LLVSNNFRIFARRFCVSYIEIQMNDIKKRTLIRMMKETNIHSQVTSTIAGDDGEAMAKSEGYVAENGFVATDPTHFGKTYHDKQSR
jgi:hypothetical protein